MRHTQPFPDLAVGVSSFTLPRRSESWRIVSMRATIQAGTAATQAQVALTLSDGAGNTICHFVSGNLPLAAYPLTITWAPANSAFDVSLVGSPALLINVPIPDDLWVQPNWNVTLLISPNAAADRISNMLTQIEYFPTVGKKTGQDTA